MIRTLLPHTALDNAHGGLGAPRPNRLRWSRASPSSATSPGIVGGDRIELTTLVGPGGDAHVYEPKPADAAAMSQADIVLVNGLHFEGFLARLAETSASRARIVELTKGIKPLEMPEEATSAEHADDAAPSDDAHSHHNGADPHAFQAVSNARVYVKNIADAFCAADAAGCDSYRANALVYDAKLEALDAEVKAAVAAIPARPPHHHHLARRVRLFRQCLWHSLSCARRHLDRGGGVGRRCRPADPSDSQLRRRPPSSSRTFPIRA